MAQKTFPSTSHQRRDLEENVRKIVPPARDADDRKLIHETVEYITGSKMVTIGRFASLETMHLDQIDRPRVQGVIEAVIELVADKAKGYDDDLIDVDRTVELMDIITELNERFDELECSSRVYTILHEGHHQVDRDGQILIRGAIAHLSGAETERDELFAAYLDRILEGKNKLSDDTIDQLHIVLDVMQNFYSSALLADRAERLERAFDEVLVD